MVRPYLPLNALRAFEAAARHLSFTRASIELCVTQAAVSHQVKLLEQRLGVTLFRRLPRGLMITEEGLALLPALQDSFDRMAAMLERFEDGHVREVLKLGAVGTLAVGWLLPRLADFREKYPFIDLRLSTNNNRVDIAAEGLDYTIKFGNGAWHDIEAEPLFETPLSVLCIPPIARQLKGPEDVAHQVLLRSYRADEWPSWFEAAHVAPPQIRGLVFDSSVLMVEAAMQGPAWHSPLPDVLPPACRRHDRTAVRDHHFQGQLLADAAQIPHRDAGHGNVPQLACATGGGDAPAAGNLKRAGLPSRPPCAITRPLKISGRQQRPFSRSEPTSTWLRPRFNDFRRIKGARRWHGRSGLISAQRIRLWHWRMVAAPRIR